MSNKDDCISRLDVIDAMKDMYLAAEKWLRDATDDVTKARAESCMASLIEIKLRTEKLPAAQPELTDEQSIAHLQSSGWMQRHDKEMYESGLKEKLADDSDSYDSLLPTVHPEVIRCKDCEHWKNEHLCKSLSRFGSFETKADFYCGYAERKINERTG